MNFSPSLPPEPVRTARPAGLHPEVASAAPSESPAGAPPWAQAEWNPAAALRSLVREWRLIAGAVVLAMAVAWTALSFWPRQYTAETLLLLDPRNQPDLQLDAVLAGFAPDDQTISSEVLILRSATLAAKVIADLSLADDPDYNPALASADGLLSAVLPNGVYHRLFRSAQTETAVPPEAALEAAEVRVLQAFSDRLEVERVGRSHALRVAVTAGSPEQAADVANRLADRYLEGQLSVKFEAHGAAQDWLAQRVGELQENVEAAEQAVEEYRVRSGLIDSKGVTVTDQQMGEINTRLIAARADTAAARARLAQVRSLVGRNGDALSAAEVLSSPLIHRLKEQEVEVLRRRADLSQEFGPRHPRMLSVEAELADIRDRILAEVRQIVAGLTNEVAVAVAQEEAMASDLARLEGKTAEQNQAEVRLRALEREAEASRNLLETFLARIKETSNQEAIQRSDARVLTPALPPYQPSSPRTLLVLAAAAVLSFLVTVSFVLARSAFRHGAGDLAGFRARTGLQVLACVEKAPGWRGSRRAGAEREARLDHAAMLASVALEHTPSVLVTAVGDPAMSVAVAIALAKASVRQGETVLLADGEIEDGTLTARLGLRGTHGFADVLAGEERGPLPTVPSGIDGLRILSAGRPDRPEGGFLRMTLPGGAMTGAALDAVWPRFGDGGSRLIMHGGPALGSASVRHLAGRAAATVLVARWSDLSDDASAEAAAVIRAARGRLAGVILMEADPAALPGYDRGRRRGTAPPSPFAAAPGL